MSPGWGFGASVSKLLETYDNCLALLKAFKRRDQDDDGRKVSKANKQQALLKHSLKTDRKKIERAYSMRLSEAGSSFEKGDSKSRSTLGKVLKKLNAAIAKLMRLTSRGQDPVLDYQSLMSLSNSSRMQAIKTFDQLSHRISSKSSRNSIASTATVKTSRSSKSSKSAKSTKTAGSKASKSTGLSASSKDRGRKRGAKPSARDHGTGDSSAKKPRPKESGRTGGQPGTPSPPASTPPPAPANNSNENRRGSTLSRPLSLMPNRFSIATMSSDSTRLGEVPERKWHRRYDPLEGGLDEYNTPIMYPLRPYQPPAKERKFLGLFRRG